MDIDSPGSASYTMRRGSHVNNSELQCIIFDFGGVISQPQDESYYTNTASVLGVPPAKLKSACMAVRHEYDKGMAGQDYWANVFKEAGVERKDVDIQRLIDDDVASWTTINEKVLDLAFRLSDSGQRIAMLSNLPRDHLLYFRENFEWLEIFSVCVFSCELGLAKPEPDIYSICLNKLNAEAEKCLFIDDREDNVAAARESGIKTIQFTTFASLETELSEYIEWE
jgi:putative hydrolase of the HAD superfamily